MTCRQAVELLSDYLDGALPQNAHQGLQSHLAECENCRHYSHSFVQTIRLARAASLARADELMRAVPASLVAAILDFHKT
jgi:anti-sigma factor RsiW